MSHRGRAVLWCLEGPLRLAGAPCNAGHSFPGSTPKPVWAPPLRQMLETETALTDAREEAALLRLRLHIARAERDALLRGDGESGIGGGSTATDETRVQPRLCAQVCSLCPWRRRHDGFRARDGSTAAHPWHACWFLLCWLCRSSLDGFLTCDSYRLAEESTICLTPGARGFERGRYSAPCVFRTANRRTRRSRL